MRKPKSGVLTVRDALSYVGRMINQGQGTTVAPAWTLSDRLRKAREFAGLQQSELANTLGISRNSVSSYEGARSTPRRPVLRTWADVCGVSYEWLTGGQLPRLDSNQEPAGNAALLLAA